MVKIEDIRKCYQELRAEADTSAGCLFERYRDELRCRKGCALCCVNVNVLPVEWYCVHAALGDFEEQTPLSGRCGFLKDDACSIYTHRPIICRIHGIPLRYRLEEYDDAGLPVRSDTPGFFVTWCDENFAEATEEEIQRLQASPDALPAFYFSDALRTLNVRFLQTEAGRRFGGSSVIDIYSGK